MPERRNLGGFVLPQQTAPASPATGEVVVYAKTDGKIYRKTAAGVETELGGGGVADQPIGLRVPAGWGRNWRTALSERATRLVRVKNFGTSIGQGYSAGAVADSYFEEMMTALQAEYGDGGTGLVTMTHSTPFSVAGLTPRAVTAGGTYGTYNQGYGGSAINSVTTNSTITISNCRGRNVRIYYESYVGSTGFTVRVNGVLVGTINSNVAALNRTWDYVVPGGTADGYTLEIRNTGTGGVGIHAVDFYNNTGVVGHNMAKAGNTAAAEITHILYTGQAAGDVGLPSVNFVPADLIVADFGGNDFGLGVTAATFQTQYNRIIETAKNQGPHGKGYDADVILLSFSHDDATRTAQGNDLFDHVNAEITVADNFDAAFLNLYARWPLSDAAKLASGLFASGDRVHPLAGAHQDVANTIIPLVTALDVGDLIAFQGPPGADGEDGTGGGGGFSSPDVVTKLITDFQTTEPQQMLVMSGEFVATTTNPRIEVETSIATMGVQHAMAELFVGPGVAFPLSQGTVAGPKVGVSAHPVAATSGEYGKGNAMRVIYPPNVSIGQTVRWELRMGVVGYAALVSGISTGDVRVRITPDNNKIYALTGTRVIPLVLGRQLSDHPNVTQSGEYLGGVPFAFTSANDIAFHPTLPRAYIADWFGTMVHVMDTDADRIITSIPAAAPIQVAMTQDGSRVFAVTGAGTGSVKIINTTTHAVTTQTLANDQVQGWACRVSPDGTKLAVYAIGASGQSNRLYVYTIGTGGTTWTLTATILTGGSDGASGSIAWEGNNVVWVPLLAPNNLVVRCQVDTQQASSFAFLNPNAVAVSNRGMGVSLFVVSNNNPDRMAYYVLPSVHNVAPTKFDNNDLFPYFDIVLSSDDFIYYGTTDGQMMVNQGGLARMLAHPDGERFWGEGCEVKVYGGTPV